MEFRIPPKSSPHSIDQASDIAVLLEPWSDENRERVQTWLAQLCKKLAPVRHRH